MSDRIAGKDGLTVGYDSQRWCANRTQSERNRRITETIALITVFGTIGAVAVIGLVSIIPTVVTSVSR